MHVGLELFSGSDWQRYSIEINPQGQEVRKTVVPESSLIREELVDCESLMLVTAEKVVLACAQILQEALKRVKDLTPATQSSVRLNDESASEVLESTRVMLVKLVGAIKQSAKEDINTHCDALGRLKEKVKELIEAKKEVVDRSDSFGLIKFFRKLFIAYSFSSWSTDRKLTNTITQITDTLKTLA